MHRGHRRRRFASGGSAAYWRARLCGGGSGCVERDAPKGAIPGRGECRHLDPDASLRVVTQAHGHLAIPVFALVSVALTRGVVCPTSAVHRCDELELDRAIRHSNHRRDRHGATSRCSSRNSMRPFQPSIMFARRRADILGSRRWVAPWLPRRAASRFFQKTFRRSRHSTATTEE